MVWSTAKRVLSKGNDTYATEQWLHRAMPAPLPRRRNWPERGRTPGGTGPPQRRSPWVRRVRAAGLGCGCAQVSGCRGELRWPRSEREPVTTPTAGTPRWRMVPGGAVAGEGVPRDPTCVDVKAHNGGGRQPLCKFLCRWGKCGGFEHRKQAEHCRPKGAMQSGRDGKSTPSQKALLATQRRSPPPDLNKEVERGGNYFRCSFCRIITPINQFLFQFLSPSLIFGQDFKKPKGLEQGHIWH